LFRSGCDLRLPVIDSRNWKDCRVPSGEDRPRARRSLGTSRMEASAMACSRSPRRCWYWTSPFIRRAQRSNSCWHPFRAHRSRRWEAATELIYSGW